MSEIYRSAQEGTYLVASELDEGLLIVGDDVTVHADDEVRKLRDALTAYLSRRAMGAIAVERTESGMPRTGPAIPGLLEGPRNDAGFVTEVWSNGKDARARVRCLRSALPGRIVNTRTEHRTRKLSAEPGADRTTIEVLVIAYFDPHRRAPELPGSTGRAA